MEASDENVRAMGGGGKWPMPCYPTFPSWGMLPLDCYPLLPHKYLLGRSAGAEEG